MSLHDRFGFQFKRLLAGAWEFENTMNDRDYYEMPSLLIGLVNNLGLALEERALDPYQLRTLPFPNFSYAVVRTDDMVMVLIGRGPVQSVRYGYYYDVRKEGHHLVGEDAIERLKSHDLYWDNYLSAQFPSDVTMMKMEQREVLIREEAQKLADVLAGKAALDLRQAVLHPHALRCRVPRGVRLHH
jgi:hypothetical protein